MESYLKTDREKVLESLKKTEQDVLEHVAVVQKWLETQKHLPEIPAKKMIESFLIYNDFNIEETKQGLDLYYSIKSIAPKIYGHRNPDYPLLRDLSEVVIFVPMPKLNTDLKRVFIKRLNDSEPKRFDADIVLAAYSNFLEIIMWEDISMGDICILDYKFYKKDHISYVGSKEVKKFCFIETELWSAKIKEIHIVNAPSFAEVVGTTLLQHYDKKIYVHKSLEDFHKFVSPDILPKEYGGKEKSLDELYEIWKQKLEQYKDRFIKLENMVVNEALRPTPNRLSELSECYNKIINDDN